MAATQEPAERDLVAQARLLVRTVKTATLATAEAGNPHAAMVTLAWLERQPLLLLSDLAVHTRQLDANPACSLLLLGEANSPNPQTTARLCLTGTAARTSNGQARTIFLASHPYADLYVDFADFGFWQIAITGAYFIGGFGAARLLEVAELTRAL